MRRDPCQRRLRRIAILAVVLAAACAPAPPSPSPSPAEITANTSATATTSGAPFEPVALVPTREWIVMAEPVPGTEAATIAVAVGHAAYIDLWLQAFPGRAAPAPPFDEPVVVIFGVLVAFGCETATMDALVVDADAELVYGEFSRTSERANCGDIGGTHTFVVAIDRGALPRGRMTFRLEREFEVCADCGREREQVEVDL